MTPNELESRLICWCVVYPGGRREYFNKEARALRYYHGCLNNGVNVRFIRMVEDV